MELKAPHNRRVSATSVMLALLLAAICRLGASPMTIADLKLKDGQELHNVTIVAFGTSTVMAKWDGGRGTIRNDDLPDGILPSAPKNDVERPAAAVPPTPSPQSPGQPPAPQSDFQTPWQFETQYIVTEIASDLTEMAYYAKNHTALPAGSVKAVPVGDWAHGTKGLTFEITGKLGADGELNCLLPINRAVWSPETYRPLVDLLFSKLNLKADVQGQPDSSEILQTLLEPTVEHLVSTDAEISAQLSSSFTSSLVHERSALLMSIFELRQPDNKFFQTLFELCRTTSHLAFAGGLSGWGTPSQTGQIAGALLSVEYGDQSGALVQAKRLSQFPELAPWQRVIRMSATSDFRIFDETDKPTLLERFERFRSYGAIDAQKSWSELNLTKDEALEADWWRILGSSSAGVQLGHEHLSARIPVELREIKIAFESETGSRYAAAGIKNLNAHPMRCVSLDADGGTVVHVLGWGTWAAFLQRELCDAVTTDYYFIDYMWGLPDEAAGFRKKVDDMFWELELYPLVRRENSGSENYYHQAQDDAMALVRRSPESVPAEVWNDISYAASGMKRYVPPPHPFINEWHRPNPPPGTVYNIRPRFLHPSLKARPDYIPLLQEMHALAPYNQEVDYHLIYALYSYYPPPDKVEEIYGGAVEYHGGPCMWIAELSADIPGAYEKWMNKAILLSPRPRWELAIYFAMHGREEMAKETFETWLAEEKDDVLMSNTVDWLVEYREGKGDEAGATDLASKALATGSGGGMITMAHLLERRKDYAGAYAQYANEHERYNRTTYIVGFLMRMKKIGSPEAKDSLLDNFLKSNYPAGLVPAEDAPSGAPSYGAEVNETQNIGIVWKLRWQDVIVSMNGYRVNNPATFHLIQELDPSAPLTMTIWRNGAYITLPPCAGSYIDRSPKLKIHKQSDSKSDSDAGNTAVSKAADDGL
jgi:hypothetical protein